MDQSFQIESDFFSFDILIRESVISHVNVESLERYFEAAAQSCGEFFKENFKRDLDIESLEVAVVCCDESEIKELNKEYRNKDKCTDVLSFPIHEDLRSKDFNFDEKILNLGDIFICHEVALSQAKEFNLSFEEEFIHLFIHGFLHLCGLDHELSQEEEKVMEEAEAQLLKKTALFLN